MTYRRVQLVFLLFIALSIHGFGKADVFTSMSEIEELLQTEEVLINNLEDYVAEQEHRLEYLKREIAEAQWEHDETFQTASDYVLNPVNAYRLMRRFTRKWKEIILQANDNAIFDNSALFRNFPGDDDLNGAAIALTRLRYTYDYSSEMTPTECFEVGKQMFIIGDYYNAKQWMKEALNMLTNATDDSETNLRVDILEYLAIFVFNQAYASINNIKIHDEPHELEMYERLCRGEVARKPHVLAKLKCRYDTDSSPYSKIAPFKLEEASLNPYIVIYHDVVYDEEIEVIKELTKPKLQRSLAGLENDIADYRISKNAWLEHNEHDIIQNIGLRVQDMTGLTVTTAEELQVGNYGIGGHYETHPDFFDADNLPFGDRIATVLFYMSNVAQGGATVFPLLNVTIKPEKGSAVFWYNIRASGEVDFSTVHAGCPVLVGSKWIANKWLHERGQEFLRPCGLVPDHDNPTE